jgi:RNA polymerase sigma factor (sigma-70 family)
LNAITDLLTAADRLEAARDLDDATLLGRFAAGRDDAAFEALVWRHGGLVRGICRRYLPDPNDIDDATQATFVALARKARSVRSVGPWLAQVAARAARRLRRTNAARAARYGPVTTDVPAREPAFDDGWRGVLAEEIARLPDHYRAVVRRCYLDGLSAAEVGREFGWARGTVLTRLAWAKVRLRQRLTARGVTLGAGGVVGLLFQLAAGPVTRAAVRDVLRAVTGSPGWRVARLTDGVLTAMFWTKVQIAAGIALACGAILIGTAVSGSPADSRGAAASAQAAPKKAADTKPADTKPAPAVTDREKLEKAQNLLKKAAEGLAKNPQDAAARKLIQEAQELLTQMMPAGGRLGGGSGGGSGGSGLNINGGSSNSVSVQVGGGSFTIAAEQDGVTIDIEGTTAGGVTTPTSIRITDGTEKVAAGSLDKVPAKYRERVEKLLAGVKGGP